MSGTYRANGGETWSDVARSATGTDTNAAEIRRVNPGIQTPIPTGAEIQIPMMEQSGDLADTEELTIRVSGKRLGTVPDFELLLPIDAPSKGGFSVPNAPKMRELFTPLTFPMVTVDCFGKRVFTGRADPPAITDSKTLDITIWSSPAILETCPPPSASFPHEWKDATFKEIANHLAALHGVTVDYLTDPVARFKRVDISQGDPVFPFLSGLAGQRGLIMSSDASGRLVVHDGTGGELVGHLEEGKHPAGSIGVALNGASYYSDISVSMPAKSKRGKGGKRHDIKNPITASGIIRPYHYTAQDVDEGELKKVAESVAGRMFGELLTASASVPTWKNDAGGTYWPGQHVTIKAEEKYIEKPYQMLISMVTMKKTPDAMTADLGLVMPGVYSGEMPEVMPWQK